MTDFVARQWLRRAAIYLRILAGVEVAFVVVEEPAAWALAVVHGLLLLVLAYQVAQGSRASAVIGTFLACLEFVLSVPIGFAFAIPGAFALSRFVEIFVLAAALDGIESMRIRARIDREKVEVF